MQVREPVEASPFGCSGTCGLGVRAGRGRGEERVCDERLNHLGSRAATHN